MHNSGVFGLMFTACNLLRCYVATCYTNGWLSLTHLPPPLPVDTGFPLFTLASPCSHWPSMLTLDSPFHTDLTCWHWFSTVDTNFLLLTLPSPVDTDLPCWRWLSPCWHCPPLLTLASPCWHWLPLLTHAFFKRQKISVILLLHARDCCSFGHFLVGYVISPCYTHDERT